MPVLVGIAGLIVLYLLAFAIFPQVRAATHTGFFVLQVLDLPIKPQSWFTREAVREEVTYPGPSGGLQADIYRIPDGKPRAAILIFLGANAAGREDRGRGQPRPRHLPGWIRRHDPLVGDDGTEGQR